MALRERTRFAEEVAEGVFAFGDGLVNWYLVEEDGRLATIDAGFPPDWETLVKAVRGLSRQLSDVHDVVLTHAHIDHVGFAERARLECGATVHMHPEEISIARSPLPWAKSERLPLFYLHHPPMVALYALGAARRAPLGQRIREQTTLRDGEVLEGVAGRPKVIFAPGHTFGHCALHVPERGVLFTGDALVTRDPYTGATGPRLVARAATADSALNLRSLAGLEGLEADVLLPGHGEPWRAGVAEAVALARSAGAA
jgi:glyoxylase-like metal-dependent hydrolase (beta-lactamase superfamily II)